MISPAWASEISPARRASLVSGHSSRWLAVRRASRASLTVAPAWRASHAGASEKPISRCTPAFVTRDAARSAATEHALPSWASSPARRAQSAGWCSPGSKSTSRRFHSATSVNDNPDTRHLLHAERTDHLGGGSPAGPQELRLQYSERVFVVKDPVSRRRSSWHLRVTGDVQVPPR